MQDFHFKIYTHLYTVPTVTHIYTQSLLCASVSSPNYRSLLYTVRTVTAVVPVSRQIIGLFCGDVRIFCES